MPHRATNALVRWWQSAQANPGRALLAAGVAQVLVFGVAAVLSADAWGESRSRTEAARWAFVAGQSAAFAAGYRAVRSMPSAILPVVALAVPLTAAAVCVRPFHSTDVYTYINRGWQQAEYRVNPYTVMVYETPNGLTDPMFYPMWLFDPCPYGFVFALEAWGLSELGGRDHPLTVVLHKASAVVTFWLLGAVVWWGLRAARSPAPAVGLYMYACHPLLLVHHVGNAHNDLQMTLGVAAAVVAAGTGLWLLVFPLLAAGALVKAPAVLAAPVLAIYMVRRYGLGRTGFSLLLAGAVAGATAVPYLGELLSKPSVVAANDAAKSLHNSLAAMAHFPFEVAQNADPRLKRHADDTKAVARSAAWAVFAVAYLVILWRQVRAPAGTPELARGVTLVLTALVLCSPKFHVWYVGWLVPLAVWLPPGDRLRRLILAVSVAGLLGITGVYKAHFLNALVMLVVPVWWALRRPTAFAPG